MSLTPIAATISPDEKAYALIELNMTPYSFTKGGRKFRPSSFSGLHRYQVIMVNRSDRLAEYHRDMGDAALYPFGPIRIPSLWEHTVAELQDIADDIRHHGFREQRNMLVELRGRSTLKRDALRLVEEVSKRRRRQSVFGPAIGIQR